MSRRRNADGIREERINKIIQFIKADHKNGGLGIISNEIIDEVSGTKVDSNSKTVIRKSIPFVDNEYIIPIQLDDGGARRIQHTSYSFLSKEEYDNYKFTSQNFKFLNDSEINNIISKVNDSLNNEQTISTKQILKILTLCDTIKNMSRNGFAAINERLLSVTIMETKNTLHVFLELLVKTGIIEKNDDTYRFIYLDPTEIKRNRKKSITVNIENSDDFIKSVVAVYEERSKKIKELEKQVASLQKELNEAQRKISEDYVMRLTKKDEALEIVSAENRRIQKELAKEKADNQKYADNIKDYKEFRNSLKDKVQSVMDHFMMSIKRSCDEYEVQHNLPQFITRVNMSCSDTIRSVVNVVSIEK